MQSLSGPYPAYVRGGELRLDVVRSKSPIHGGFGQTSFRLPVVQPQIRTSQYPISMESRCLTVVTIAWRKSYTL